jgi:hypothetical protein
MTLYSADCLLFISFVLLLSVFIGVHLWLLSALADHFEEDYSRGDGYVERADWARRRNRN